MRLVATRVLPPEVQPPDSLCHHPDPIYSMWLSNLPEQARSLVLPYLSNCSLSEQLKEVRSGG